MRRQHRHINIPTDIVRTLAVVAETGSFSKAAEKLRLSQPAVSSQMKRLQVMVGGPVFERTAGGVAFTPLGKLVLAHSRKLLEANDQILSLGGGTHDSRPLRLGLSILYVEPFLTSWGQIASRPTLNFQCDGSFELAKGLSDGYLDVAILLVLPDSPLEFVEEWLEEFVWVRSADFVLSPGAPLPLVTWPGSLSDIPMITALEKAGMPYRVAFASSDHYVRSCAVAGGVGIMAMPRRQARGALRIANEYYLPPLTPLKGGIAARAGIDPAERHSIVELLRELVPTKAASRETGP